jgi:hypothetical protein
MKTYRYLVALLFSFSTITVFSQTSTNDCSVLKHGQFKYLDIEDTSAYVVINGASHIEYHNNGKYYIKSKLKWINDCEYIMTMTEITIPNFPFYPGDKMKVVVTKIEDGIIYYNSIIGDRKWPGRLRII